MQSTGTIKNMQTAAMRLSKMMSSPVVASGRLSVRPALMPRSLHISAVLSASRASRTQRTSSKSRAASPAKTAASPDSAQSSKIQVLPFTMTPPRALHHAGAVTVQALSKLRTSHSHPIYMKAWSLLQVLRGLLRLPHKLIFPNVLRWRAIYLPVWRLDHIVSLKERISGDLLDLEATSLGTIIPATQTEPLASAPLSYVYDPLQSGDLEAYNPQKHLQAFKPEDLLHREDIGQKPMVIPFSSMLPDIEALWRKAANNSENENIEFTGEFKTILQSASPILMPYYLVDFQDLNPSYSNDPVTTCLIFGRTFPNPTEIYANAYHDGRWLEGKPTFSETAVSMLVQPHSNEETGVPELLLPKAAQHQAALALIQLSQEVRPEIQNQAIKLDTDTKLSDFEKKIEDMDWIRKYGDCAEKNEKYAFARVQSRVAEQRHLFAQAMGDAAPDDFHKLVRATFDEAKKRVRELAPPWVRT